MAMNSMPSNRAIGGGAIPPAITASSTSRPVSPRPAASVAAGSLQVTMRSRTGVISSAGVISREDMLRFEKSEPPIPAVVGLRW